MAKETSDSFEDLMNTPLGPPEDWGPNIEQMKERMFALQEKWSGKGVMMTLPSSLLKKKLD